MRYGKIMESNSIRDMHLSQDFWESKAVWLSRRELISLDGCPDKILGDFTCSNNHLVSLAHAPRIVGGDFNCGYNLLTSLDDCPHTVGGHCYFWNNRLTSLADIHTHIQQMDGILHIGGNPITSHILGVLLIRGCTEVADFSSAIRSTSELKQAVEILNKHLGQGRAGIMDCQAEMIAHGLDEFAQI